ncbi:MAG TPA: hypothetical protein VET48_06870 [Steroidobacteraceae bacterium]|nr:hypothetical protein [Steroidobacteraceae bacterium]
MAPVNPTTAVTYIGIGALIAWRVYVRIRRFISRQKLSTRRLWTTVVLFPILVLLLLAASLTYPTSMAMEMAGVVIGIALGIYGLRVTKYENTPEGLFYTPHAHIGIAVSLLFVGRLTYRFVQIYVSTSAFTQPQTDFVRSPLTLLVFGILAGYYTSYAIGLLNWSRAQVAIPSTDSTVTK